MSSLYRIDYGMPVESVYVDKCIMLNDIVCL